jgi:hypothetical protein
MALGVSAMTFNTSYAQEKTISIDYLIDDWVLSSLESGSKQIVFRNKDDFFVNNDFFKAKTSQVINISKIEKGLYSASISNFRRFSRCGNDIEQRKGLFLFDENWTLENYGQEYYVTITRKKTYLDQSFTEIKRKYELVELNKGKMVLALAERDEANE